MCRLGYLPVLVVLASCSSGSEESHSFRIYREGEVTIAETIGGPKYEGELFEYEPVLTLKENPDNEDSYLFRPGSFTMDEDGYFYVIDGGNYRIAVFDSEGNYVRSFGRKGEGPGEFLGLSLQYLDHDVLHIYDLSNTRTTRYATDGILLEVVTYPQRGRRLSDIFCAPQGLRICTYLISDDDHQYSWSSIGAIFVSAAGETLATVATTPIPTMFLYNFETGSGVRAMEYSGTAVVEFLPGKGLLLSNGVEPKLDWYNEKGVLYWEIRLDLPPEQVSDQERNAIIRRADEEVQNASEQNRPVAVTKAARDALKIPDKKAFWGRVMFDDKGFIWLQKPEPWVDMQEAGGFEWRVLNPEGEYLGDTRLPWRSGMVVSGRFLGYTELEDTGERIPTVFLIRPAVEGLEYP